MFAVMAAPFIAERLAHVEAQAPGVQIIFHRRGNTIPIMEHFIAAGVDCYQSPQATAGPEFLEEVAAEVEYQVKRLRDHPAIALWCGDNEWHGALVVFYPESQTNRDLYAASCERLPAARQKGLARAGDERVLRASSPCPGFTHFASLDWNQPQAGDMHNWDAWHMGKELEACRQVRPRFVSEVGFQALPSLDTLATFRRRLPPGASVRLDATKIAALAMLRNRGMLRHLQCNAGVRLGPARFNARAAGIARG